MTRILRMKLQAERFPSVNLPSAGVEAGVTHPSAIACLDPFVYRDTRWCSRCGGEQLFVEVYECEAGRVGVCFGCGDEKLIRFSRAVSEAS